jgi:hypothetical protein
VRGDNYIWVRKGANGQAWKAGEVRRWVSLFWQHREVMGSTELRDWTPRALTAWRMRELERTALNNGAYNPEA